MDKYERNGGVTGRGKALCLVEEGRCGDKDGTPREIEGDLEAESPEKGGGL